MAKVRSPRCPGCGAALPLRDVTPWVRCSYCGREVEIARTQQMSVPADARASRPGLAIAVVVIVLAAAIGAATVVMRRARTSPPRSVSSPPADAAVTPPAEPDARVPELNAFVGSGNLPVLVDLDDDEVEDIVGRFTELASQQVGWMGAFSGKDLSLLWRAGPFAEWPGDVRYAQAGGQLVVVDPSPAVHVLDPVTGESRARADLSDRARQLCVAPDGAAVFVDLIDEQHVRVTPATGAIERAPRPTWCPTWTWPYCRNGLHHAPCTPVDMAYRRDDFFSVNYLVRGNDVVIGVGNRRPGSRFPMIGGFASGGRKLLWHRLVPEGDPRTVYESPPEHVDLVDGTGFVVYAGAKHDFTRLQAFDPATGAIAWDVEIPGGATTFFTTDWLAVTKTRVYLAHNRVTLSVFDRATGAPERGLGAGHR